MDSQQIAFLEKPFELDEHGFVEGNPYILKRAYRKRFNNIDPHWSEGAPEVIAHINNVISIRMSIVVSGAMRYGVGTGIVQASRKDKNTGAKIPLDGFDLDREYAKAIKSAASDALARAAQEFNVGWYLREIPKPFKDRFGAAKKDGEKLRQILAEYLKSLSRASSPNGTPETGENMDKSSLPVNETRQGTERWTPDENAARAFLNWAYERPLGLHEDQVWEALRMVAEAQEAPVVFDSIADWPFDKYDAMAAVVAAACKWNVAAIQVRTVPGNLDPKTVGYLRKRADTLAHQVMDAEARRMHEVPF